MSSPNGNGSASERVVPDPDLPLLHTRDYEVRSWREAADRIRLRGEVRDTKPAGLYIDGDPEPLRAHHMVVDLVVQLPSMEIVDAGVVMDVHPHERCPSIVDHYDKLIGLSIARGYTHKVRELFGGPRGCTHTTALLQAMGPVAIQSLWSLRAVNREMGVGEPVGTPTRMTPEERRSIWERNLNTCHVWAEDGDMVAELEAGAEMEVPVWAVKRLTELGRDPAEWRSFAGD